jgi:hypothetical protein
MVLAFALSVFAIGSYLVWPSRWNISAHISIGLALTAYLITLLLMKGVGDQYPRPLFDFYRSLIEVGAGLYMIGLVSGAALPRIRMSRQPRLSFVALSEQELVTFVSRRAIWLGWFSIIGMAQKNRRAKYVGQRGSTRARLQQCHASDRCPTVRWCCVSTKSRKVRPWNARSGCCRWSSAMSKG